MANLVFLTIEKTQIYADYDEIRVENGIKVGILDEWSIRVKGKTSQTNEGRYKIKFVLLVVLIYG